MAANFEKKGLYMYFGLGEKTGIDYAIGTNEKFVSNNNASYFICNIHVPTNTYYGKYFKILNAVLK